MSVSNVGKVEVNTERFKLRLLTAEDVTERYLGWLGDAEAKKWIAAAKATRKLSELREYVLERVGRDDVLFFGIFEKNSGLHVGNLKYEPVDSVLGYAIMGILIGDPAYRGRGVTTEVLRATAQWLKEHRNIKQLLLGVSEDNFAAIRAYKKTGFVVTKTPYICPSSGAATMSWRL